MRGAEIPPPRWAETDDMHTIAPVLQLRMCGITDWLM